MGEPKAFASLSSGLLARKGAARPAMRPQGFGTPTGGAGMEDLGWNDMGFEAPKPAVTPIRDEEHDAFGEELPDQPLRNPLAALTPIASPVHDQQAEIAERFASHDEEGEDEDGEYVDETAELYDPEAEDASPVAVDEPETDVEAGFAPVFTAPVRATPTVAPARSRRPRAAPGSKGKSAFTLRLDPDRHLKLRLACAVDGRSAQQLVTDALDHLLQAMPELQTMAEKAPRKKSA